MRLLMRLASGLLGLSMVLTMPALADDIYNWSDTDSLNNRAAPNGWQSGVMLPSQVEPTARAMMGAISRNTAVYNIRQFGAVGDWNGSTGTDNTSAIQNAVSYVLLHGGKLIMGPGSYKLSGQITGTFAADKMHVTLEGAGKDKSYLVWTNGSGGIKINYAGQYDSVDVRDFTFATTQTGGGTALNLTMTAGTPNANTPVNEIKNVGFRGDDGYGVADYWTIGIQTNGMNNVNFIGNTFTGNGAAGNGIGVDLEGTITFNGAVYNFVANQFTCQTTSIKYGTYIQGVVVTGGNNFTCGTNGILVPAAGTSLDQLTVTGNQFGSLTYGIRDQTGVNGTMIANNLFITSNASSFGISLEANATRSIVGNECQAGSGSSTCINITNGGALISNNNIISQNKGIILGASSAGAIVTNSNAYTSTTTAITDSGTGNVVNGDFTWSPTVFGSSVAGTPSYGADSGTYHRDGKKISATFYVTLNTLGSMSGNMEISGFPLTTSSSLRGNCSLGMHVGFTGNPQLTGFMEVSTAVAQLVDPTTGGNATSYTAPVTLVGQCDYETP